MNPLSDPFITPEIRLADKFLYRIPRAGELQEDELTGAIDWNNPAERDMYVAYRDIALEILLNEGYIKKHHGSSALKGKTIYSLTQPGRVVRDGKGYLHLIREKKKKEAAKEKVEEAEGKKKIHDNKTKNLYALGAIVAILTGFIACWEKCAHTSDNNLPEVQSQRRDSIQKQSQFQPGTPASFAARRHHPKTITPTFEIKTPGPQTNNLPPYKGPENRVPVLSYRNAPVQTATSDNIDFKLVKAIGNAKAQSITFTVTLTTSAANRYILSAIKSIIDPDGNEYKLKSFTIGASTWDARIDLNTGVPIKCTYTFGGVLPDVKVIKLFKYEYMHPGGESFYVEFRDVPIDWR